MQEKIYHANAEWEKKNCVNEVITPQKVSFMERLLQSLQQLKPGRIYGIGNGKDWLRVINSDDDKITIMNSFGAPSDDRKDYSYAELAKYMSDKVVGFPSLLKNILQSPFDDITLERLS